MIHGMIQNRKILSVWKGKKQREMKVTKAASRNRMVTATKLVSYFREGFEHYLPAPTRESRKNKHLPWLF
jgi:hypothetical protein